MQLSPGLFLLKSPGDFLWGGGDLKKTPSQIENVLSQIENVLSQIEKALSPGKNYVV